MLNENLWLIYWITLTFNLNSFNNRLNTQQSLPHDIVIFNFRKLRKHFANINLLNFKKSTDKQAYSVSKRMLQSSLIKKGARNNKHRSYLFILVENVPN